MRVRAGLLALLLGATVPAPLQAQKDDDWGVKRNPFDPRIVDRWKAAAEHNPDDTAAVKKLWALYRQYSTTEKLIAEYEARVEKSPGKASLAMLLGKLYELRPDVDKALAAYARAAAAAPTDAAPLLASAELLRRGHPAEAAAAYQKALAVVTGVKDKKAVLRALAELALDADDLAQAQQRFEAYIELEPGDVGARLDLADALAKHGKHDLAVDRYRDALKRLSSDPARRVEVLARVGGELEALGRDDEAITIYQQAMELAGRAHYLRKQLTERVIDIHRKRQDLRALVAEYEKAWPAGSRGHFEWEVLARLHEETGDQDKALEAYRRAVAAAPAELDTQRRLIALLDRAGRDDEVIRQYEALIRVAPGEPRFRIQLAERFYRRGDKGKALALLKEVGGQFPDDAGVHAALADLYSRWGEDPRALKEYETLVRIEPGDDTHLVNLGEQHFQKGDKPRAVEVWKRIAGARTAESYARLGEVYAEHDLGPEAIDMYQKALALKPKEAMIWKGLAGVLERQRQDDRAIDAWERVMELTTGSVKDKALRREARTRIISIWHRKSGSPLLAKTAEWVRRFRGSPPDLEAGYRAAEAYIRRGQLPDAERILSAILRLDPGDLDAKHQLVSVLKSQRKYQEAIDLLKELTTLEPALERQYEAEIAELELALYHDDAAIAYAQKVLEKSPSDAQAQERLAEIYAKRGDNEKAAEAYRRALELDHRNDRVRFALAKLYLRAGKQRDAALLYREIIKTAPVTGDEEILRTAARKAIDLEEYLGTLGELERELAPLSFQVGGRASYRRILVDIYDRYVPPLVARAHAGDHEAEAELVRLGEHGLKPLLEALEDVSDVSQARVAVRVLGYLGNKNAAAPLVKLALESPAPAPAAPPSSLAAPSEPVEMDTRVEALVAAGRLGDARVIPQLVQLLNHREVALREAAAWALGQTRSPRAVEPLLAALGDARPSVHALACVGLGRAGDKRALEKAADVMRDTTRAIEARTACAYALGVARSAAHVNALVEVVGSGNDDLQVKAAWALGRIADPRAAPALLRALWLRGPMVRDAILWALARVGGAPDLPPPPFEDVVLENGKVDVRGMLAAVPAAELPRAGAPTPVLLAIVRGREGSAALAAGVAEALAQGARRDLILRVLRDLDAREDGVALGPLTRDADALPAADRAALLTTARAVAQGSAASITDLCAHPDAEVRQAALSLMAKLGGPAATRVISAALGDAPPGPGPGPGPGNVRDEAVVLAALRAAQRQIRGTPDARETLAKIVAGYLSSPSWRERAAAALALGAARPADLAPLVTALGDAAGFVREAAARALVDSGRPEAVPALVDASRDEVAEVRLVAAEGLAGSADARARARVHELQGDPDARVRAAATR